MARPEEITRHYDYDPDGVEWIDTEPSRSIEIADADPSWPSRFAAMAARIRCALGDAALDVDHVGSTSVPGLAAKPIIDIDVTVPDPRDEATYVPALEAAGFRFRLRERRWHEHRLFHADEPQANVHVFGPDCPEVIRHRMLRDWLTVNSEDRQRYEDAKRASAAATNAAGETTMSYNQRKESVIREILDRMFRANGLLGTCCDCRPA
jgi:GrpB-like predicted nucleotidyltransferase (UPF0157 family)